MKQRYLAPSCIALLLSLCWAAPASLAQEVETTLPDQMAETPRIQIGLSTDTIYITTDFSGADLTVFGAVTNLPSPSASGESTYNIAVALEGPRETVTVRKKSRVFGIWMNTQSEELRNVPLSYSLATSGGVDSGSEEAMLAGMGIGVEAIAAGTVEKREDLAEFVTALRRQRTTNGLYNINQDAVQMLSRPLFRARLNLPPDIPVGLHVVEAYLFEGNRLIDQASLPLKIAKSDWEQTISRSARHNSLLYGLVAVLLAVLTGWLGRIVFKRD